MSIKFIKMDMRKLIKKIESWGLSISSDFLGDVDWD